jgi:AcrR family transcriptional regulator
MARKRTTSVDALIDAAITVFERHGYADTTMDDVAAAAGVSKFTLYQYVESKQWLLDTIVRQMSDRIRVAAEEVIYSDAPAAERLAGAVRLHVDIAVRWQRHSTIVFSEQHHLSPKTRLWWESYLRDRHRQLKELFDDCVTEGVVRDDIDIGVAVNLFNGMFTSIHRWYRPGGRFDAEALAVEALKFLSCLTTDAAGIHSRWSPSAWSGASGRGVLPERAAVATT